MSEQQQEKRDIRRMEKAFRAEEARLRKIALRQERLIRKGRIEE